MRQHCCRWKVESLSAWLQHFWRLVVRYERYPENFLRMLHPCLLPDSVVRWLVLYPLERLRFNREVQKMAPSFRVSVVLVLLVGITLISIGAQNVGLTKAVFGRAAGLNGTVIPGVTVVVANLQTSETQSSVGNRSGVYREPRLGQASSIQHAPSTGQMLAFLEVFPTAPASAPG